MIKSTETKNLKMMDKSPLTDLREDWEKFKPDRVPRAVSVAFCKLRKLWIDCCIVTFYSRVTLW